MKYELRCRKQPKERVTGAAVIAVFTPSPPFLWVYKHRMIHYQVEISKL